MEKVWEIKEDVHYCENKAFFKTVSFKIHFKILYL